MHRRTALPAFLIIALTSLFLAAPAFAAGNSITGTVNLHWNGLPLSGIIVEAYTPSWEYAGSATTGDSGTYTITNLAPGYYYLHTSNTRGYEDQFYKDGASGLPNRGSAMSVPVTETESGTAIFYLDTGAVSISGKVVRDSDGGGLPGILVIAYMSNDYSDMYVDWTFSDASGNYVIAGLPFGYGYELKTFNDLGYIDEYFDNVDAPDAAKSAPRGSPADFSLAWGGWISGTVTRDSDGSGIAGIQVQAQKYVPSYVPIFKSTVTDSLGRYRLSGLPTGNFIVSTANANSFGYVNEYYDNAAAWGKRAVAVTREMETPDINFGLANGGSISGKLTKATDGTAVFAAYIYTYTSDWDRAGIAVTTDWYGNYSLTGLLPGSYYLQARSSSGISTSFQNQYYPDSTSRGSAQAVIVQQSSDTSHVDMAITPTATGSISGVVLPESGGSLGNYQIRVYTADGSLISIRYFSGSRYQKTGLLPGSYYVEAYSDMGFVDEYYANAASRSEATMVSVEPGIDTGNINFDLTLGATISGKVTRSSDGAGIAAASIAAYDPAWRQVRTATADSSGNYNITGLAPGSYYIGTNQVLGFIDEYFSNTSSKTGAIPVTAYLAAPTENINFELEPGLSISGTVTSDLGVVLPDVPVNIFNTAWEPVASTLTDASGFYSVEGLQSGDYYVQTGDSPGHAGEYHHNAGSRNSAGKVFLVQDPCTVNFSLAGTLPASSDSDGDRKSDITVWRPETGTWYVLASGTPGTYSATQWGLPSDVPVSGDYDADAKTDIAVWRPETGIWYVLPSSTPGTYSSIQWGLPSDLPVPGDYDGDGRADLAVWRPDTGIWYILPSGAPGTYTDIQWGVEADTPVPQDYDGDGKTDVAVWRPVSGTWFIQPSSLPGSYTATQWGVSTDIPVPGDYDGDGKADPAAWRPGTGIWYSLNSRVPGSYTSTQWGVSSDIPTPGDYDGDGTTDVAVWRSSTGMWYVMRSGTPGSFAAIQWGVASDIPISTGTGILR